MPPQDMGLKLQGGGDEHLPLPEAQKRSEGTLGGWIKGSKQGEPLWADSKRMCCWEPSRWSIVVTCANGLKWGFQYREWLWIWKRKIESTDVKPPSLNMESRKKGQTVLGMAVYAVANRKKVITKDGGPSTAFTAE